MGRTLITFLGRTQPGDDYQDVSYQFPDGSTVDTDFIGDALRHRYSPDTYVVLGTAGSMWSRLVLAADVESVMEAGAYQALEDSCLHEQVTPELLAGAERALKEAFVCQVHLRLVPAAFDETDQIELVRCIADAVADDGELVLDVTHGYRHLPLTAFIAVLLLRAIRPNLELAGFWYAVLNKNTDPPVGMAVDLAGLLQVADWLDAVRKLDLTDDFGALATVVSDADAGELMGRAGFLLSTHQLGAAASELRKARSRLGDVGLSGIGQLFGPVLRERMSWVDGDRVEHQRRLAWAALERGDLLRAGIYGREAVISRTTVQLADGDTSALDNHRCRDDAEKSWDKGRDSPLFEHYRRLCDLRNLLAHGESAVRDQRREDVASHAAMEAALRECFEKLLPDGN